jgi:hypothetical protein
LVVGLGVVRSIGLLLVQRPRDSQATLAFSRLLALELVLLAH